MRRRGQNASLRGGGLGKPAGRGHMVDQRIRPEVGHHLGIPGDVLGLDTVGQRQCRPEPGGQDAQAPLPAGNLHGQLQPGCRQDHPVGALATGQDGIQDDRRPVAVANQIQGQLRREAPHAGDHAIQVVQILVEPGGMPSPARGPPVAPAVEARDRQAVRRQGLGHVSVQPGVRRVAVDHDDVSPGPLGHELLEVQADPPLGVQGGFLARTGRRGGHGGPDDNAGRRERPAWQRRSRCALIRADRGQIANTGP